MSSGRPPLTLVSNPPKTAQAREASTTITTRKQTSSLTSLAVGHTTEDMLKVPAFSGITATDAPLL